MDYMKKYLCFALFICLPSFCFSQLNLSQVLNQLDKVILDRQQITNLKLDSIQKLKEQFRYTRSTLQKYQLSDKIYKAYSKFETDSAGAYARYKLALAYEMNNLSCIEYAKLNIAEVYHIQGMYIEALRTVGDVKKEYLDKADLKYYFNIYRTLYGYMADYASDKTCKRLYTDKTDVYRDSLLAAQNKGSFNEVIVKTDELLRKGYYREALALLSPWLHKSDIDMMRSLCYTFAMAYRQAGDAEKEEYYFALSAIADLKTGTKEYLSLLELSKILFKKGDLDRAYAYMKTTMEDAAFCNARLRTIEASEIYPIVVKAYQHKLKKKELQRTLALSCVSLLAVLLAVLLFFLNKQKNKLSAFRKDLINLNKALKTSNGALKDSNVVLKASNASLVEANCIKEASVSQYMELCSLYIEKMGEYQHSLIRIASNEKTENLYKALKSSSFIDKELKDFYSHFDRTFLQLFPTFVDDLNNLLVPEGKIHPKVKGQLNVELRIFALIRLGISDSVKIASFLRYSIITIYNYRVKIRNAAKGDRNLLEKEVMNIGCFTNSTD